MKQAGVMIMSYYNIITARSKCIIILFIPVTRSFVAQYFSQFCMYYNYNYAMY